MKRNFVFTLYLAVTCYCIAYPQGTIDSLKKIASTSRNKEVLCASYGELCRVYNQINVDSAIHFGNKSIELAGVVKENILYNGYRCLGDAYTAKGTYDSAIKYLHKSLQISMLSKNAEKLELTYYSLSMYYNTTFNLNRALECLNKAILHAKSRNNTSKQYEYLLWKAHLYSISGDLKQSTSIMDRIKAEIDSIPDLKVRASFYQQYALNLNFQRRFEETILYATRAKQMLMQLKDYKNVCHSSGHIYWANIMLFEKTKKQGYRENALGELNECLQLCQQTGQLISISNCYNAKAYLSRVNGDAHDGINFARLGLKFAKEQQSPYEQVSSYGTLSKCFEALSKYDSVFKYYVLMTKLRDSVKGKDVQHKMEQTQMKADFEYKELLQKTREEQLTQENKRKLLNRNYIIAIITLLFGGLFLIYVVRKQKQLRAKHEEYSKQLIITQEQEKTKIAMELHDNIGQNLLLVKNQLNLITEYAEKTKQSIQLVDKSIEDIRSLSRQLHPHLVETIGFTRAVNHMLDQAQLSTGIYFTSEITEEVDNFFSKEDIIHIYRILQECVNNIIKHSKAESAKISIAKEGKSVLITIQDNGVGFNKNILQSKAHNSFGFTSLKERVAILKGELDVETSQGKGVIITISIPKNND